MWDGTKTDMALLTWRVAAAVVALLTWHVAAAVVAVSDVAA